MPVLTPYPPPLPPKIPSTPPGPPPEPPPPPAFVPLSLREALMLAAYGLQYVSSENPARDTFPLEKIPTAINLLWSCSLLIGFEEDRKREEAK